ncbi:phosphotransferase [Streptomyces sp. NPDC056975]|uniref:phosphotransferase n=1 Tax=Streptomyces sp. NPDC056975 TaxID=3345985 RepID=UPI003634585E
MIEDGATDKGSVTTVRRIGETIRRPVGEWTPAVHALLTHLESVGFTRAPRVIGTDGANEVLSLLRGEPAFSPWPSALRSTVGICELASWLRDYHDAVRDFQPPADARWQGQESEWRPGMVIRHGDLGPWNSIWNGDRLAGFIDWDFAAPGHALDDLAQLAWYAVPLRPIEQQRRAPIAGGARPAKPPQRPLRRLQGAPEAASTPFAPPTGRAQQQFSMRLMPSRPARLSASNGSADEAMSHGPCFSRAAMRPRWLPSGPGSDRNAQFSSAVRTAKHVPPQLTLLERAVDEPRPLHGESRSRAEAWPTNRRSGSAASSGVPMT